MATADRHPDLSRAIARMHVSSHENMRRCVRDHVVGDAVLRDGRPLKVLDVGGADVNGSYRPLFSFTECHYVSADLSSDSSVDVVLDGTGSLPFATGEFDVVVSGQTFEHVGTFWDLFSELVRVCSDDGVVIVIAPSAGAIHRFPVDCYRFLPDSYAALAERAGVLLVDHWLDPRGPFHDLVGVFRRKPAAGSGSPSDVASYMPELDGELQNAAPPLEVAEHELSGGRMPALALLKRLHEVLDPRFYLEVGVFDGASLRHARCPAIGIDPDPRDDYGLRADQRVHVGLSSDFFRDEACVSGLGPLDLVYIDGMHLIENAYEDFINVESHAHPCSVILVDDIYPNHPQQARRTRASRHWTGDVWKIVRMLRVSRPDLVLLPVDTSPTGTLVVLGADPGNRSLWESFDLSLMYAMGLPEEPPSAVLHRTGALAPTDPLLWRAIRAVRRLRDEQDPAPGLVGLRSLVKGAFPRKVSGRA